MADRTCENCGKKIPASKPHGKICQKCADENIAFYANLPQSHYDANQERIYGKKMTPDELLRHLQQKNDED